jgi:hypothetical protein
MLHKLVRVLQYTIYPEYFYSCSGLVADYLFQSFAFVYLESLHSSVQELVRTVQDTNRRVERLSISSSRTEGIRDGDDTSMQVMSGSENGSRSVLERLEELRTEVDSLRLLSGQRAKAGSLSCASASATGAGGTDFGSDGAVDEFYSPMPHRTANSSGGWSGGFANGTASKRIATRRSITFAPDIGHARGTGEQVVTGGVNGAGGKVMDDDGDEFMRIKPAQVEDSWGADGEEDAQKRFRAAMLTEAAASNDLSHSADVNADISAGESRATTVGPRRPRPASMPAPDSELSD